MSSKVVKWVIYLVPVVLFALLLNTGTVLKRPMGRNDRVEAGLHAVEEAVLKEQWATADREWDRVQASSIKVGRRIEIAAERDQLQDFYEELARLRGSIQAHERGSALEHISVLKALFDEFGR